MVARSSLAGGFVFYAQTLNPAESVRDFFNSMRQEKTTEDKPVAVILISILVLIIGVKLLLIYKESRKPEIEAITLIAPITRAVKIEPADDRFKKWWFHKKAAETGMARATDREQFLSLIPLAANIYYTEKLVKDYLFIRDYRSSSQGGLIAFEESDYFLFLLDKEVIGLDNGKIYFETTSVGETNKGQLGIILVMLGAVGVIAGLSAGESAWLTS